MASNGTISKKNNGGDSNGEIPAGWLFVETDQGSYYTNEVEQQFETMQDLMRYVNYAKRAKLSIYAPDYKSESSFGHDGPQKHSEETPKKINESGPVMATDENPRRSSRLAEKKD